MNIPTIGQSKGLFETFIPGVFFLLNLMAVLYAGLSESLRAEFFSGGESFGEIGLVLVILICGGYLVGTIMRMLLTSRLDRIAGWYVRNFDKKKARKPFITDAGLSAMPVNPPEEITDKKAYRELLVRLKKFSGKRYAWKRNFRRDLKKLINKWNHDLGDRFDTNQVKNWLLDQIGPDKYESWAIETFPYYTFIRGAISRNAFPQQVIDFYDQVWKGRGENTRFFNFCKVLLFQHDNLSIRESISASATNLYMSGMFYALSFSMIINFVGLIGVNDQLGMVILLSLQFFYLLGLWGIISRFRYARVREVRIVFDTSFQHRHLFEQFIP